MTREIQGLPVAAALDILAFTPRKAAVLIAKTLKSADRQRREQQQPPRGQLVVKEATVGEGPTFKRFQPKARGSAGPHPQAHRHIRIILTDEIEIKPARQERRRHPQKDRKPAQRSRQAAAPAEQRQRTNE